MSYVFDLGNPATNANPFPEFARLRAEDPVHWSPVMKAWIVTRYADVKQVALNNQQISADRLTPFFKANPEYQRGSIESLVRYLNHWMVFRDPPDHTRLRRLFTKAFTPTAVANLRPNIEDIVAHLIDGMLAKARRGETVDYIADFAYPLPASVIMDLLGVPRAGSRARKGVVRRHRAVHRHRPGRRQQVPARRGRRQGDVGLFPHPGRGAHRGAHRRHDQPARAGARRSRRALDRRDHRHLHPAAVRRPRDHHQPHRQRLPLFDEASRPVGAAGRRSGDGGIGGRGISALRRPVGRVRAGRRRRPRDGAARPSARASASSPS